MALSKKAAAGERFVIGKAGRPMVSVTALDHTSNAAPQRRRLGFLEGKCEVPDDFDQMGTEAIADLFEGGRQGG